jgi:hypothetical protein
MSPIPGVVLIISLQSCQRPPLRLFCDKQALIDDLNSIVDRIKEGWQRSKRTGDDYYLDNVALHLHGFYSGPERIFELIANSINNSKPDNRKWQLSKIFY